MRQVRRLIFSVRKAHSSRSWPSRHSLAPYASSTAIRITEMGAWTPASGRTPGMRRPVRTITRPSTCLRRMAFGLPTSPAPSGVIVAALRPKPVSRKSLGSVVDDLVAGLPAVLEREVEVLALDLESEHVRLEEADRLAEELLAGLVPVEHDHG